MSLTSSYGRLTTVGNLAGERGGAKCRASPNPKHLVSKWWYQNKVMYSVLRVKRAVFANISNISEPGCKMFRNIL